MFNKCPAYSPVEQSYIWLAEYYNGYLAEFDFKTKKENSFYDIEKEKLVRFGLVGKGNKLWFEVSRGVFNLFGKRVHVTYKTDNEAYELTKQNVRQEDIITYKKAFAEANAVGRQQSGIMRSNIINYNFGYKAKLKIDDTVFYFKPIITIPENTQEKPYITVRLSADKDLDGQLEIAIGNKSMLWDAPLKKGVSGELSWYIV